MRNDTVVIANCGGFLGDDPTAARRQVEGGPVDYLVMDYLAEVTMAILHKQRQRRPDAGYAGDFLLQLADVLPACIERGITVITNAGGINPTACAAAVERLAKDQGLDKAVRVGVVLGDDISGALDELVSSGEQLANIDTGAPITDVLDRVQSANAYLGAFPIARALRMGANVVITGRVADAAVTLGPLVHELGWKDDDWDRLAAGVVAGHIIECGTQCTGGNFTDWQTVPTFRQLGYPLVEGSADGTFVVTKHPGTGGLVNVHTVTEQLLYEIGGSRYLTPDCVARFDTIALEQEGPDRVRVSGVRGEPAPEKLKVSINFDHGYRIFGRMVVSGPDTLAKATKAADIFWAAAGGVDAYEETETQFIGWDASHPPLVEREPSEVLVQVAARDADRGKLDTKFAPSVAAGALGSVPGFTVPADQGRPRASDVVGYWPALVSRDHVRVRVRVGDQEEVLPALAPDLTATGAMTPSTEPSRIEGASHSADSEGGQVTVPLGRLCLARAGDKGDLSNIGVIARSPAVYAWMREHLTASFVGQRFEGLCAGQIERHELPNLLAMNFVLHEALGGGGTMSLRLDAQGKTYAQYLLATEITADTTLLEGIAASAPR